MSKIWKTCCTCRPLLLLWCSRLLTWSEGVLFAEGVGIFTFLGPSLDSISDMPASLWLILLFSILWGSQTSNKSNIDYVKESTHLKSPVLVKSTNLQKFLRLEVWFEDRYLSHSKWFEPRNISSYILQTNYTNYRICHKANIFFASCLCDQSHMNPRIWRGYLINLGIVIIVKETKKTSKYFKQMREVSLPAGIFSSVQPFKTLQPTSFY